MAGYSGMAAVYGERRAGKLYRSFTDQEPAEILQAAASRLGRLPNKKGFLYVPVLYHPSVRKLAEGPGGGRAETSPKRAADEELIQAGTGYTPPE